MHDVARKADQVIDLHELLLLAKDLFCNRRSRLVHFTLGPIIVQHRLVVGDALEQPIISLLDTGLLLSTYFDPRCEFGHRLLEYNKPQPDPIVELSPFVASLPMDQQYFGWWQLGRECDAQLNSGVYAYGKYDDVHNGHAFVSSDPFGNVTTATVCVKGCGAKNSPKVLVLSAEDFRTFQVAMRIFHRRYIQLLGVPGSGNLYNAGHDGKIVLGGEHTVNLSEYPKKPKKSEA